MPATIPLRALVLYKHGVGTFTRAGTVDGTELELPFRAAEVDDALKSLVVQPLSGAQVTGVRYATPLDRAGTLAELPIELGTSHGLFDLLRCLRGTAIELRLDGSGEFSGRVVGIEEHPQGREFGAMLVLQTGDTTVQQIATDRIVQLRLGDGRLAAALGRYLDTVSAEEGSRTLRVGLSAPGSEVRVMYTIPSPVWRVSYRLAAEVRGEERRALLQGWGIFDNRTGEDLADVEVTLVAGQPVSFRYDLTSSVIPERALVRDEARIAAGPVEFEGEVRAPAVMAALAAPAGRRFSLAARNVAYDQLEPMDLDEQMGLVSQVASGGELDELFEYRVGGVSVGRGESAMVPIAQHIAPYRRELLYNGAKHPEHPVAAFRLRNETGLTLERGPVTVFEDGRYRGEAMLQLSKAGAEIVLVYAVELGITVREHVTEATTTSSIRLQGAYLQIAEYFDRRTEYALENTGSEAETVTVERVRWHAAELAGTPAPDERTAEHDRWLVECEAHAVTTFTVTERLQIRRSETVLDEDIRPLAEYLRGKWLTGRARTVVQTIVRLRQTIADTDREEAELLAERNELGTRQDRLRKNLSISAANAAEEEIRRRSAEEFRRTQEREDEIEQELVTLGTARAEAERELNEVLAAL